MYYLGLRSSQRYLDSLESVRKTSEPFDLISVAGGLAFLHAISPSVRSLTVIDTDQEPLMHWRLIQVLIEHAQTLDDFLTLLSGHKHTGQFQDPRPLLLTPISVLPRLKGLLPEDLFDLYVKTYGALSVRAPSDEGRIGDSTVKFRGMDLTPMTFCWHFGSGAFAGEENFQALRHQLASIPISAEQRALEVFDFAALHEKNRRSQVLLASNCESPLFTKRDQIFRHVIRTVDFPFRYVSWHRDMLLPARETGSGGLHLNSATQSHLWVEPGCSLPHSAAAIADRAQRHESLESLRDLVAYGLELAIVCSRNSEVVFDFVESSAPTFKKVLWFHEGMSGPPRELAGGVWDSYRLLPGPEAQTTVFMLRGCR